MNEDRSETKETGKEKPEKGDERFYEPKNWDKIMRIEDLSGHGSTKYCGKCGHGIHPGDSFCTKCGAESRE